MVGFCYLFGFIGQGKQVALLPFEDSLGGIRTGCIIAWSMHYCSIAFSAASERWLWRGELEFRLKCGLKIGGASIGKRVARTGVWVGMELTAISGFVR